MQTLALWPFWQLAEWGAGFGLVIVDEAHHVPCATLTDVLYELPGRYRLGLTATPTRADGLTPILLGHMGPIRATVSREALAEAGAIIVPRVERIATGWSPDEDLSGECGIEYVQMITDATEDEARNIQIADLAAAAVKAGRHVLIQTERVEHAKVLSRLIGDRHGLGSVAVYGALGAKARALALSQVASGACPILIATQLADEGLDLPILDTLILGVPQRNAARLEQRVGRVARPAPGKVDAIVYDLVDSGLAARLQWARLKVYRMMGCAVSG
jgi:superfamily II DNA or RNA helicase